MNVWNYIRMFSIWAGRCARAWIEIGHRVQALEANMLEGSVAREREDERLQTALASAVISAKDGREKIHQRIDELDQTQRERLTGIDRAQQTRIDAWAQQLSSQINQLYMAIATSPVKNREG